MPPDPLRYDGATERRGFIRDSLRSTGFLSVSDLSRELGVSDMTVRRDLRKLADSGEARLVRGGVSLPQGGVTGGFAGRADTHADAKSHIARATVETIALDDTIALDAGTTAYALAGMLPGDFGGCVVTHSVPILQLMLDRTAPRVVGLGGDLFAESQAFVGPMSVDVAARLRVRSFFLGAAAVDTRGVYVAMDVERPTKQALMDISDRVVLLVDNGKFDTSAPVRLCGLDRLDGIVTDRTPPPDVSASLAAHGVTLTIPEARS